jgi:DNA-binding response OmpR family regulator
MLHDHDSLRTIQRGGGPLPEIVLLVDDDPDTVLMYSAYFESAGVWVATSTDPAEAVDAVRDLQPDLVVTDIGFKGRPLGADLVHSLKSDESTKQIPVIVLSGRADGDVAGPVQSESDLWLVKPVLPDALLLAARRLIRQSRDMRQRAQRAVARATDLADRSSAAIAKASELRDGTESLTRKCPECGRNLEWIETGRLGGVTYDYFRWCDAGCGLFCYNRIGTKWVRLA